MTPTILQAIVGVQIFLLALTLVLSFAARSRGVGLSFAWINTILATAVVGIAAAVGANVLKQAASSTATTSTYALYAVISFGACALTWISYRVIASFLASRELKRRESPQTISRLSDELREVLRGEGIELDARLRQAEQDREQFLYALEERHARQIAGLAQEYQHEAHTILRQLLDQLAAEQLQPMVEQRLAEQRKAIESELGAIDTAVAGETLTSLREGFAEIATKVEEAEARITKLRDENPDRSVEEIAAQRLDAVEAQIAERMAATQAQLDDKLAATVEALDTRINSVGALLDEKVEAASNPLAARMNETQAQVEQRLQGYLEVLSQRFAETEQILNQRIVEQESALEARVVEIERGLEQRLNSHASSIEAGLNAHDTQLHESLAQQSQAVSDHFSRERDRLIGDLTAQAVKLQEQVAAEMAAAEAQARETVGATQQAWNHFTEELEHRFAETREEALRAAKEIAAAERQTLEQELATIVEQSSGDIAAKVEALGREAAWQRAQVERTVVEQMDLLKSQAEAAVANADTIFADLDRIGGERVAAIRRQAEEALVQSRDYVQQLQDSLGQHLDALREQSAHTADEMNERLAAVAAAGQQSAAQLEQYSRELLDSTMRELGNVAEGQVDGVRQRLVHELEASVAQMTMDRQRAYEMQVTEMAQRIVQQVQGDLAGIAEHARTAIASEIEMQVTAAREHALRSQEQAHMQVMNELARQQSELADQARSATGNARTMLEDGLRDARRDLEEAMASMGAHMREELVRFQDEGQRRVQTLIEQLRGREQELIRDEDRKLAQARQELVRQHEGALQDQMRTMMGSLSGALSAPPALGSPGFASGVERPATPLSGEPTTGFGSF